MNRRRIEGTLTPRECCALLFAQRYSAAHGYAATVQEIADHCGLRSKASGFLALQELVRAGLLRHDSKLWRTYVPVTLGSARVDGEWLPIFPVL